MNRFGAVVLAVAFFASAGFVPGSAIAQTKIDCSRLYMDFWEKIDRENFAKLSGDHLAGASHSALRAYDACQAGDELEAKEMFDRLHMKLF